MPNCLILACIVTVGHFNRFYLLTYFTTCNHKLEKWQRIQLTRTESRRDSSNLRVCRETTLAQG